MSELPDRVADLSLHVFFLGHWCEHIIGISREFESGPLLFPFSGSKVEL